MALSKCKECGNEVSTAAKACPKCGAPAPKGFSIGRILLGVVGAFVALSVLGAVVGGRHQDNGSKQVTQAGVTQPPAVPEQANAPERETDVTLEFGKPRVKTSMGTTDVDVEAKNVSGHDVKGCMVTATFKNGDTIVGTANGAVNQLPAGATRTAQLMGTDAVAKYDTLKIEAATCF